MAKSIFSLEEESRKKEIAHTALEIIDNYGIKGLTVARISKEVGFVESALYRHFKSKRNIISFILDQYFLLGKENFIEVNETSDDPVEQLKLLLKIHLGALEDMPGLFKIVHSDEIHIGDDLLLKKLNLLVEEMVEKIKVIFQKGVKKGALKKGFDLNLLAINFLGIVQTAFTYWTINGRKSSITKIGGNLLDQLLSGIKK
ncbi:MAG: TetR/AcrR family transcriptional regulator [Candidatus Aminicenantaceae bacterium]